MVEFSAASTFIGLSSLSASMTAILTGFLRRYIILKRKLTLSNVKENLSVVSSCHDPPFLPYYQVFR